MEDSGLAVAILRKPSDRLASQFRWMRSMLAMVTIYGVFVPVQQILINLPDIYKLLFITLLLVMRSDTKRVRTSQE